MTERLYHHDSYLRLFDAQVIAHVGNDVILDRTAFYPGGGGQPCDTGILTLPDGSPSPVSSVRSVDGHISHIIEGNPPSIGSIVHGSIDWDRRLALMRTHTALHILCGVVWRDYQAQVTGGNMEPGRGRLDFEFASWDATLVAELERKINDEVEARREIRVAILPRAEAFAIPDLIRTKINLLPEGIQTVRVVEIVGLDLQADGGTHVANTAEVGPLRILSHKSKGRINKRIAIGLEA